VFVEIISPDGTQQLAETRQVYHDTTRPDNVRNSPMIGEKLTVEEDPKAGAIRGFQEELFGGQNIDTSKLVVKEITSKLPKRSDTYTGLTTRAKISSFALQMPQEYFDPNGYQEVQEEKGKTNIFEWVPRYVLDAKDVKVITEALEELKVTYTLSTIPNNLGKFSIAIGDKDTKIVDTGDIDGNLSVIQGRFQINK
jgi:ATP-dependent exoDNAse (exonuclease V) alpha subunit